MNLFFKVIALLLVVIVAVLTYFCLTLKQSVNAFQHDVKIQQSINSETTKRLDQLEATFHDRNIAGLVNGNMPVGTILAYGGNSAALPPGWLLCDGASVTVKAYPELFAVIGRSFGGMNERVFNLPDFRGRFLRGVDHGSGRDPDSDLRQTSLYGGNFGDQVGSFQSYATAPARNAFHVGAAGGHSHMYKDVYWMEYWGDAHVGSEMGSGARGDDDNKGCQFDRDTARVRDHVHKLLGGDSETRPVNIAVEWIIRVK